MAAVILKSMMDLEKEFEERGPWVTRYTIDGVSYGGNFDAMKDQRIEQMFEVFPDAATFLELGSLEGGHSFAIAGRTGVKSVKAVEARPENIERAKFVQGLLGDDKVEFVEGDVTRLRLSDLGKFDAVFCSGILYHLDEPWKLIEQCRSVSPNIFIWTQYACENEAKKISNGYRGKWYKEGGWSDPLSGTAKYSFWLSMGSLINLLTANGYDSIRLIENNLKHPNGCAVTLAASAS